MLENIKTNSFLDVIRTAKKNNNLAFLIGSGFSSSENTGLYKNWNEIIEKLKERLDCDNETDNLKIAQMHFLKFGAVESKNFVRSLFPSYDKPGELHKSLVDYNADYIITTNWDKLIDNAIKESLRGYDVIASDSELVESKNRNKLIKMHGDFDHDNYVFTEQDYLDYTNNFPLIENYVKTILSTHICVLFGYSFNDIDFKQIVNWLKNNSKKQLPIYMISTSTKSKDECAYLETFGIKNIQICTRTEESKESFISFLRLLDKRNYEDYSNTPEEFLYEKIKHLNGYASILQSQIQDALSNCGFVYDSKSFVYLCFHDLYQTVDINHEIRKLYTDFYHKITEYEKSNNETYKQIKHILKKADIHGFTLDSLVRENKYEPIDLNAFDFYSKRFNFDFSEDTSTQKSYQEKIGIIFSLYSMEKYEKAFSIAKEELYDCKLNKDYIRLFISLINYNIILRQLKFSLTTRNDTSNKYFIEQEIDIDNEYSKFPESVQEEIRPIYEFVSFKYLHREFYKTQNSLEKIREHKYIVFDNALECDESYGTRARHKNLIDFIVNNGICIEDYKEFKDINEKYFEISLINNKDDLWIPNKTELYTVIRYIKTKDLKEIIDLFTSKKINIAVSPNEHTWLINVVLENCVNNYCNRVGVFTKMESYLENTLLILAVLNNSKEQTSVILDKLNKLVQNTHNTLQVFDEINLFLGIQYNFIKNKNIDGKKTLDIVESLLRKFVSNDVSGYEDFALSQNKLSNLLGCTSLSNVEFSDRAVLSQFIKIISIRDINEQLDMLQGFILQLYCISDVGCKAVIAKYAKGKIKDKDNDDINYLVNYYSFRIYLHLLEIEKLDDSFKADVEKLINLLPKGAVSYQYDLLNSWLKQLAEKNGEFKDLSERLDDYINDGIKRFNEFFGNK